VRIVAIGGGEIGRPGYPVELTAIDAEVVRLTGKRRPLVVFLPTATVDDPLYVRTMEEHYGGRLGCRLEPLTLFDRTRTQADIARVIAAADIVYVGGGNTLRMMKLWRRRGVDRLLQRAASDGTVLAGVSAGAICWCTAGVSDSRSFTSRDDAWPYIAVRGLGLVDLLLCPHHDAEPRRQDALRRLVPQTRLLGIGLDDCAALEVIDDRYRILSCREGRIGHVVDRSGAAIDVPAESSLRPLSDLRPLVPSAPARR
jgi:dipeptidase E